MRRTPAHLRINVTEIALFKRIQGCNFSTRSWSKVGLFKCVSRQDASNVAHRFILNDKGERYYRFQFFSSRRRSSVDFLKNRVKGLPSSILWVDMTRGTHSGWRAYCAISSLWNETLLLNKWIVFTRRQSTTEKIKQIKDWEHHTGLDALHVSVCRRCSSVWIMIIYICINHNQSVI